MRKIMKMLDGTIRHQQPMLIIKVISALGHTVNGAFDKAHIVRMGPMKYEGQPSVLFQVAYP